MPRTFDRRLHYYNVWNFGFEHGHFWQDNIKASDVDGQHERAGRFFIREAKTDRSPESEGQRRMFAAQSKLICPVGMPIFTIVTLMGDPFPDRSQPNAHSHVEAWRVFGQRDWQTGVRSYLEFLQWWNDWARRNPVLDFRVGLTDNGYRPTIWDLYEIRD